MQESPTQHEQIVFWTKEREVALDQIRSVDKIRFLKKLGLMDEATNQQVIDTLQQLFSF